jgi:hypothetical protein
VPRRGRLADGNVDGDNDGGARVRQRGRERERERTTVVKPKSRRVSERQ